MPHEGQNAKFVSATGHDQLVPTFRAGGVHPLHKGQYIQTMGTQLVLAMERGLFHRGQYAVFISVCRDQAIYERFLTKNTLFGIIVTGAMTKSILRGLRGQFLANV